MIGKRVSASAVLFAGGILAVGIFAAPALERVPREEAASSQFAPEFIPYWASLGAPVHPRGEPGIRAFAALVVDQAEDRPLYAKNPDAVRPIASITKLMTAVVVLEAGLPLDEMITIEKADVDTLRHSRSRLRTGTSLPRRELLNLALMSSENRAAAALARTYPEGKDAFVAAMNRTAAMLKMSASRFVDPVGLSAENVSTSQDLVKLVKRAYRYDLIRDCTTTASCEVCIPGTQRIMRFANSNALVGDHTWSIGLSKTGYISEAGPCLVMQALIADRPVIMVLLDAAGKYTRLADARRIRRWIESAAGRPSAS